MNAYKADHPNVDVYVGKSGYIVGSDGVRHDELFDDAESAVENDCEKPSYSDKLEAICKVFREESRKFVETLKTKLPFMEDDELGTSPFKTIPLDIEFLLSHFDCDTRKTHLRSEHWAFDSHVLDDIVFNAKMLIKNSHGYPSRFSSRAAECLGVEYDASIDACKNRTDDSKVSDLACTLWKEELENFIELVMTYNYYADFGIVDEKNPDEVELKKKLEHTLPYKPGTFYEFDYVKLNELTEKSWIAVCDKFKEIGRDMWD